jgi:hypothetical protein
LIAEERRTKYLGSVGRKNVSMRIKGLVHDGRSNCRKNRNRSHALNEDLRPFSRAYWTTRESVLHDDILVRDDELGEELDPSRRKKGLLRLPI